MPFNTAGKHLAAELASHFEEGRDYQRAIHCLMATAGYASARFAHRDSIELLQHALELAPLLSDGARVDLEIPLLLRIGDAHYALGEMSDSTAAYEKAAARAEEAGLKEAQVHALARLAVPAWYLDQVRGNDICEQAIEVSKTHGDPLLVARTQLAAACFRLTYDAWRIEDAETCLGARQTIRRLHDASIPEDVLYAYVQLIQGDYEEALKQAEAGMIANSSPAAYLLALGAKTLTLIGLGRFGELLRIVRTGQELARKNGEDPWVFVLREAWLRALCCDYEGVQRLSEVIMRSDAEQHAAEPRAMAMVARGYVHLYQGQCDEALHLFEQVRDPRITPNFLVHWRWRLRAQVGSIDARLQAGDLENARREADNFLDAAFRTGEPNLHAYAWEAKARVALTAKDGAGALCFIESAMPILKQFDIPVAAWRVHATAWDSYRYAGQNQKAEEHHASAKQVIMRLADSFERDEPLRESLLTAPSIRRIVE
jgi:tetratricopeptide (TPR) repeat protein